MREIHLINNLKINILLKNDVIELKKIDINIINKMIYIDNCKIIVNLKIRIFKISMHIFVHVRKNIIMSSYNKLILFVHYIAILFNKDYLFKSNELNF